MTRCEKAQEVADRVKEKLDFWLQMEKEGWLYNWGGNEVVWLLEYLWSGGRFNNLTKDMWRITSVQERDEKIEQAIDWAYGEMQAFKNDKDDFAKISVSFLDFKILLQILGDPAFTVVTKQRESKGDGSSG